MCIRDRQWRDSHPDMKGNIRDYANVSQLVCLSNLENLNAVFIGEGMSQAERLAKDVYKRQGEKYIPLSSLIFLSFLVV